MANELKPLSATWQILTEMILNTFDPLRENLDTLGASYALASLQKLITLNKGEASSLNNLFDSFLSSL